MLIQPDATHLNKTLVDLSYYIDSNQIIFFMLGSASHL
jgi:hypothetical protein